MRAFGFGPELGLRQRRGAAAFDPASLFAGGAAGALYEVSPSFAWQDQAGTIPAAAGDPVGRLTDRSGNGNHALQPGAAARPVLRQEGGQFYLEFDGIDDFLQAAFAIAQPWERVSAVRQIGWTGVDRIFGSASNAGWGELFQQGSSPNLAVTDGSGSVGSAALPVGETGIVTERHDGAASRIAINNGAATVGSSGTGVPGGLTIGARMNPNLASYGNFRLYGAVMIAGPRTEPELAEARAYLAARAGLSS